MALLNAMKLEIGEHMFPSGAAVATSQEVVAPRTPTSARPSTPEDDKDHDRSRSPLRKPTMSMSPGSPEFKAGQANGRRVLRSLCDDAKTPAAQRRRLLRESSD